MHEDVSPLLEWYRPRRTAYPWRRRDDPYAILVSEVMLQQTQAARVAPVFERFLRRFPSVHALARAPRAAVVRAWDTLGYNRRAVALSEAARIVVGKPGGRIPSDPEELLRLPGVGPYTASAVASIAFGRPVAAVDTNVRRVVARFHLGRDATVVDTAVVDRLAGEWLPRSAPGDWNQALMDLGREVCRPTPRCGSCPLAPWCAFVRAGATPVPNGRRQPPYEGSRRQLRGGVVRALRSSGSMSMAALAERSHVSTQRVHEAVLALAREGIVRGGPAAVAGSARGRVRLAP